MLSGVRFSVLAMTMLTISNSLTTSIEMVTVIASISIRKIICAVVCSGETLAFILSEFHATCRFSICVIRINGVLDGIAIKLPAPFFSKFIYILSYIRTNNWSHYSQPDWSLIFAKTKNMVQGLLMYVGGKGSALRRSADWHMVEENLLNQSDRGLWRMRTANLKIC